MASTNTPAKRSPKKAARTRSLTKAERAAAVEPTSEEALHAALQAQVSGTDLRAAEPTDGLQPWGSTFRSWTTALYAWIAAKVSAVVVPSSSGTSTLVPDSSGNLDLTSVFGNYGSLAAVQANATAIGNEVTRATGAEQTNAAAIAATQLADTGNDAFGNPLAAGATLAAGVTSVVSAAGTYLAPPLASAGQRFGIRNAGTTPVTLSTLSSSGAALLLTLLPGEARPYRQVGTVGYALSSGIPITQLDQRSAVIPRSLRWAPGTVISHVQSGHNFTSKSSLTGTDDTVDFTIGTQSLKLVTNAAGGFGTCRTAAALTAVDLTGKGFRVWFKCDDASLLNNLSFYASSGNGFSAYWRWTLFASGTFQNLQNHLPSGEWVCFELSFADAALTGTPDRTAITSYQISAQDTNTGTAATVHFGGVDVITPTLPARYPNGVVVLCFDDSYTGQYTIARPILDAVGGVASLFPICGNIGSGSGTTYMTLAQVQDLHRRHGWEVGAHASTAAAHGGFGAYTTAQAVDDLLACRMYISANGLGDGASYAYPQGFFNGFDYALTPYCKGARTIDRASGKHETFPFATPHRLRSISGVGGSGGYAVTSLTNSGGDLDKVLAEKSCLILTMHDVSAAASTGVNQISQADLQTLVTGITSRGIAMATMGEVLAAAA